MKRQSQFVNFEIGMENRRFPEKYVPNTQNSREKSGLIFMMFKNQNSESCRKNYIWHKNSNTFLFSELCEFSR